MRFARGGPRHKADKDEKNEDADYVYSVKCSIRGLNSTWMSYVELNRPFATRFRRSGPVDDSRRLRYGAGLAPTSPLGPESTDRPFDAVQRHSCSRHGRLLARLQQLRRKTDTTGD